MIIKTIKERAEEYATQYSGNIDQNEYNAYYDGATDQSRIDIDKACSLAEELVEGILTTLTKYYEIEFDHQSLKEKVSNDFRKAMEE